MALPCAPRLAEKPQLPVDPGTALTALGWGRTGTAEDQPTGGPLKLPDALHAVNLTLLPLDVCDALMEFYQVGVEGRDACKGL